MNYNSPIFWLLFAAVYIPYWRLNLRKQNTWLLIASYIFYASWDYRFLFLILLSTFIDFVGGLGVAGIRPTPQKLRQMGGLLIGSSLLLCTGINYGQLFAGLRAVDFTTLAQALPHDLKAYAVPACTLVACIVYGRALIPMYALPEDRRRRVFLAVSMVANLVILGFFKYFDFFITSFTSLWGTFGLHDLPLAPLNIILPAGISFYTFQAMSYTVDIYRGDAKPTENLSDFALFVCFFPHLVAGPIMRAHTLLPQVENPRSTTRENREEGLLLVMVGLFKKLVIADNMAPIANAVFNRFAQDGGVGITGPEVVIGIYAFAFQIYGDFSGYSSIARGISKWLGFELVINFRMPYLAVSPADFWRRWHISLSTWLRDYLYIPIGGNRFGKLLTYRNLMITMLLGGLWHGASWTFVAWGLYHGAILCIFRLMGIQDGSPASTIKSKVIWAGRVILMFHLTCFGWLLFRAGSFSVVMGMVSRVLSDHHVTSFAIGTAAMVFFYCAPLMALETMTDGESKLTRLMRTHWFVQGLVYFYILMMILVFHAEQAHGFIYFQF